MYIVSGTGKYSDVCFVIVHVLRPCMFTIRLYGSKIKIYNCLLYRRSLPAVVLSDSHCSNGDNCCTL